jgi:restriction system protein
VRKLGLTPEDRATLPPSGKQTVFGNRVHWARTYLMKAGLVESTKRGHFRITPRGEQVLASPPVRIDTTFLNQFEEFRQFKDRSAEAAAEEAGTNQPLHQQL